MSIVGSALPQPVVVTGAGGMLGNAWSRLLTAYGVRHVALGRAEFDIGSRAAIERIVQPGVGTVVNCAAWTNVDAAEERELDAARVNGEAVGQLAARCAETGSSLVHYSTDYVFPGQGNEPYQVDASQAPINAYGRGKALGERLAAESGADLLLIRTSWVYAPWGANFVRTMLRLGAEKEQLNVVSDQRGRPSSAAELAKNTLALLSAGKRGTFHLTDAGECSWFELAKHVMDVADLPCEVRPCTSEEFPRPAPRPAYSVLDLSRAEAVLGQIRHWQDAVRDAVAEARDS